MTTTSYINNDSSSQRQYSSNITNINNTILQQQSIETKSQLERELSKGIILSDDIGDRYHKLKKMYDYLEWCKTCGLFSPKEIQTLEEMYTFHRDSIKSKVIELQDIIKNCQPLYTKKRSIIMQMFSQGLLDDDATITLNEFLQDDLNTINRMMSIIQS